MDKARVCRLCFSSENGLIDIYDRYQTNLPDIIAKHIGKIEPSDVLPKYICTVCHSKIVSFHEFYCESHIAQQHFLQKYGKHKGVPDGIMKPGSSNTYDSHGHAPHAHSGSSSQHHGSEHMSSPQLSLSDFIADKTTTDFAQMFGATGGPNDQNPGFPPFFNFGNLQRKQDYPNKAAPPDRTMTWDQFSRSFPWDTMRQNPQRSTPNADPGPPPETCEQCGKTFGTRKEAVDHMRREHNANPSVSSSNRYSNSVRRTQVQCELCHAWLSNRYALKAHMLRHTSEPKKCPQCDKISPNANALSSHIREVHAERIHKCHLCEKSFKAAVALKDHVATHTREKSYKCSYCPEEFIWRSNMYAHQKKCHPMEWSEDRKRKSPFVPES